MTATRTTPGSRRRGRSHDAVATSRWRRHSSRGVRAFGQWYHCQRIASPTSGSRIVSTSPGRATWVESARRDVPCSGRSSLETATLSGRVVDGGAGTVVGGDVVGGAVVGGRVVRGAVVVGARVVVGATVVDGGAAGGDVSWVSVSPTPTPISRPTARARCQSQASFTE